MPSQVLPSAVTCRSACPWCPSWTSILLSAITTVARASSSPVNAMDAHVAEAGGDGHRLVPHHPDPLGKAAHLHRKAHRRTDGPHALRLQPLDDPKGDLVDRLALVMELEVRNRARRAPDGLSAHAAHEGEQSLRPGMPAQDLLPLVVELRPIDGHEPGVVGAALPGQRPKSVRIQRLGPAGRGDRGQAMPDRWVIVDLHTYAPSAVSASVAETGLVRPPLYRGSPCCVCMAASTLSRTIGFSSAKSSSSEA